jgi:hypothetical protein
LAVELDPMPKKDKSGLLLVLAARVE